MKQAIDLKIIEAVMKKIESKAIARKQDALIEGLHDSEACLDQTKLDFYRYGLMQSIPPCWSKLYDQVKQEMEKKEAEEYDMYLRLKAKFRE